VTGGAGILGRHFCRGLAEFGARRRRGRPRRRARARVRRRLAPAHGVASVGVACDVASPDSVAAMVATVVDALGPIHVLHNNAASKSADLDAFFAPFEAYALEEWRR
jgi:NAD(P)-dependent dehydrogenase (short-subunit alcohol dehydrogenase family)